jgi:hypothetical protein
LIDLKPPRRCGVVGQVEGEPALRAGRLVRAHDWGERGV